MSRLYAISALALIAALIGGIGAYILWGNLNGRDDPFAQCRATRVAGGADDIGGPFELVSETGETVTEAEVITEPVLIYFGYTFCPDICPLDVSRNAIATEILEERGQMITPVFITVDPARDDVARVEAQVAAASRAYRTYYNRHDAEGDEFYLVDHSTSSYLVLPEHGFVEFFRRDTSPEEMADRIACFIDAAS